MKANNRLRKIRKVVTYSDGTFAMGVVLPFTLQHWLNINVRVNESGNCIILESGGKVNPINKTDLRALSIKIGDVYI